MRSAILQQLKGLKSLNNDGVISNDEFVDQKEKLLRELSTLQARIQDFEMGGEFL